MGSAGSGIGSGSGRGNIDRAVAAGRLWSDKVTSHSQQSLHFPHFSHRWLLHVSFVHRAQIRVDSSPQMLHENDIGYFFLLAGGGGCVTCARHRCASRSITTKSCSRAAARLTTYCCRRLRLAPSSAISRIRFWASAGL